MHAASASGIHRILKVWSCWQHENLAFHIVFNGPLAPQAIADIRDSVRAYTNLPIQFEILPSGHLSGWGSLCAAQRRIRERAIKGGYDALLWHEITRIPDPRTLSLLKSWDLPVAGALYKDTWHPGYYCVYSFDRSRQLHFHEPYFHIDTITQPTPVEGMGFGFTLVKSQVLQQLPLRNGKFAADTYFFEDLQELGVQAWACPVFVENIKIDKDVVARSTWERERRRLTAASE